MLFQNTNNIIQGIVINNNVISIFVSIGFIIKYILIVSIIVIITLKIQKTTAIDVINQLKTLFIINSILFIYNYIFLNILHYFPLNFKQILQIAKSMI